MNYSQLLLYSTTQIPFIQPLHSTMVQVCDLYIKQNFFLWNCLSAEVTNFFCFSAREIILRKLLRNVLGGYDYVLIDCPPSLGLLTINELTASDMAIITAEPGKFSMLGMKD